MSANTTVLSNSTSSYLRRAGVAIDDLSAGDRTVIAATWYTGDVTLDNGVIFSFQRAGGVWKSSQRTSNQALQWRYNNGGTNVDVIGNTVYGKWLHTAVTRNNTTGATFAYFLLSGFNPASPSFLITPSLGNTTVHATDCALFTDYDDQFNAFPNGLGLGHWIEYAGVLTQAQCLAQFAQRAPTATVLAGTYTYLDCMTAASVEVDAGSTASNFTKSGTFVSFASQPSEWSQGNGIFFGSGTTG